MFKRALVVEDDLNVQRLIERILQANGFEVECTKEGGEAIQLIDSGFDLMILDIILSDVNGLSVLESTEGLRTIVLTGYCSPENIIEAARRGAMSVLAKPLRTREFLAEVQRVTETNPPATQDKVVSLITRNCDRVQTRQEVADELGMSVRTVSTRVAEGTGMSFTELLQHSRLSIARSLLISSSLSVKEIAYLAGYQSPQAFVRVYQQYEGMSPGSARKLQGLVMSSKDREHGHLVEGRDQSPRLTGNAIPTHSDGGEHT